MRRIVVSQTFQTDLHALLAYGQGRYGRRVAMEKYARVDHAITNVLVTNPGIAPFDRSLNIHYYPVTRTPFTLLLSYDDAELRLHTIIHNRANRSNIDLADIEW